jgi:hypothetical protein
VLRSVKMDFNMNIDHTQYTGTGFTDGLDLHALA